MIITIYQNIGKKQILTDILIHFYNCFPEAH